LTDNSLLTCSEVARVLGEHPATVYKRVAAGEIGAVRLGNGPRPRIRIPSGELARWLRLCSERAIERRS